MINRLVIDISVHNQVTNFAAAKAAGIIGVIHKSSEGRTFVDRTYAKHREAAKAVGLLWGAYHFANDGDVQQQVDNFFRTAAPDEHTLMALDFEPNGNHTMSLSAAQSFMTIAEARLGRQLVIYSGSLMKERLIHPHPYWGARRLWLAQYGPKAVCPAPWTKPWLWQYTDSENGPQPHGCPGISGAVDCNSFDGTPEELRLQWAGDKI